MPDPRERVVRELEERAEFAASQGLAQIAEAHLSDAKLVRNALHEGSQEEGEGLREAVKHIEEAQYFLSHKESVRGRTLREARWELTQARAALSTPSEVGEAGTDLPEEGGKLTVAPPREPLGEEEIKRREDKLREMLRDERPDLIGPENEDPEGLLRPPERCPTCGSDDPNNMEGECGERFLTTKIHTHDQAAALATVDPFHTPPEPEERCTCAHDFERGREYPDPDCPVHGGSREGTD